MKNSTAPENELPSPQVPASGQAMELIRVWLIDGAPRIIITPHLWNDSAAWGLLLADIIRHLGNAYEASGKERTAVISRIKEAFDAEWEEPTSTAETL